MKRIILLLSLFLIPFTAFSLAADQSDWPDYCKDDFVGPLSPEQQEECAELRDEDLSDSELPIEMDDYDRIYREDGIWYGVIDVDDTRLEGRMPSGYTGRYQYSAVLISFTRDTENLTEVTFDYKEEDYCSFGQIFGYCLTTTNEGESGTITIYDEDEHGDFANFLFNFDSIQQKWFGDYDYEILARDLRPLEYVDIVSFKYILTDDEVDNINHEIQAHYDDELRNILINNSLSLEEKEQAMRDLNEEYKNYVIEYGEEIESLCENEELCYIETSTPSAPPGDGLGSLLIEWISEFGSMIIQYLLFFLMGGAIAFAIASAIYDAAKSAGVSFMKFLVDIFYSAFKLFADIITDGVRAIFSLFAPKQ